jgi:hypothetical protein
MRALAVAALLLLAALVAWRLLGTGGARAVRTRTVEPSEPVAAVPAPPPADVLPATVVAKSPPLADISLRVIDEEGTAVAGASVEVRHDDEGAPTCSTTTDGLGRATIGGTRKGRLVVGARGFMPAKLKAPPPGRIAEVVLRRGYAIGGVVVDAAGVGIAGASLVLDEPALPARTGVSGSDGAFVFEDVVDEEMGLRASAEGYVSEGSAAVAPGDMDLRIVLYRPRALAGIVVFPDGSPVAGARVGWGWADVLTGADGEFNLPDVPPGRHELWASVEARDRRWWVESVVEVKADGAHAPLRLVLEAKPRSWVRVLVLDRARAPVSGATVGDGPLARRTDDEGRAVIAFDVAPGTQVEVRVQGMELGDVRTGGLLPGAACVVTAGDRHGEEVVLRPREPRLVTIVARDSHGAALPHDATPRIKVFDPVVLRERDSVVVARDPLQAGLSVSVSAPGFVDQYARGPVPADDRFEVRLAAAGAISCRLVDDTGAAVLDGFVRTAGASTGQAEADGSYLLHGVPAGRAAVSAGRKDIAGVRTETEVRAGEVADLGVLVLRPPRVLSGRVTDRRGRPVGGARVTAHEEVAGAFSRADGSFRLVMAPWFEGRVLATKPGYGAVHRPAADATALALPGEGRVRVEVRFPAGRPAAWSFDARDPATGFRWSPEWQKIEGTTYLVKGLPPGRLFLIVATLPRDAETEVVVVEGETVPAVVDVIG